jgi:hypothetical protein
VLDNLNIKQVILLKKFFQGRDPEDCHGCMFCCSDLEEDREVIMSFVNPVFPTIAVWLKRMGHEVNKIVYWADHVLDGTHVILLD